MSRRFELSMVSLFASLTLAQLLLGFWRARMIAGSVQPAVALAALIAAAGALWFAKQRARFSRPARFAALLSTTIGVLSAISSFNAPLIGTVSRISIPLFAFALAAVLMTAGLETRYQWIAAVVFVLAFALLQFDLTRDARWESRGLESRAGGKAWNTKSSAR